MKALWIGVALSPEHQERLRQQGVKLLSGYVSQQNFLDGLDAQQIDMDSLNSYKIRPSAMPVVKRAVWSRNGRSHDVSVGYRNIQYVNHLLREKSLKKEAKRWADQHRAEKDVVIFVYSMHAPFMAAAAAVKRVIPHVKICLIVLDLPQYMDLAMNPIKKLLKRVDWLHIKCLMRIVDKYVLYAAPMAEFLKLKDGCWTVIEGSYDSELQPQNVQKDPDRISVMYSGVLDMRYGIPELLDAMELLDSRYELWLTGNGNAVPLIEQRASEDARIKFFGYLPSRQKLIDKQASATMMITPRRDIEAASRYCFPSKIFEYMASGNPVISCRLGGIPEEYFDYLIPLKQVDARTIAETVQYVADIPFERREMIGAEAREFLKKKSKYSQAEKILLFMGGQTDAEIST